MNPQIGRTTTITSKQEKIISTLIYFLERYKKSVMKSESSTGFEVMVFKQIVYTINEFVEENKRLNEFNKANILKGDDE